MEMSLILIAIIIFMFIFGTLIAILFGRLSQNEETFVRVEELRELEARLHKEIEALKSKKSTLAKDASKK